MKKKIVFINQSAGYLMVDTINQYANVYDACTLITGQLNLRNHPLDGKVKVETIVAYKRQRTWQRLFTWLLGSIQIFFKVVFRYRQADLFIVSNPPFATLMPLVVSNPFSLLIYDVYPDALIEYRILSARSPFIRIWQKMNKKVFARAQRIFTITTGMKKQLQQYVDNGREIEVVPVWTDNDFFKPIAKEENPFLKKQQLVDRFVILYSGNLGYTHDVECLVELASRTERKELIFLIIGGGEKEQLIRERIAEYKLTNCVLLPWQPIDVLPYSLASADLAVVSLGREASKLSIPSKTFNYLSVGAPLMSIADPSSELCELIENHQLGANFTADSLPEMQEFIERLLDDPVYQKQLQYNSLKAAQLFGPENAALFINSKEGTLKKYV